MSGFGLTNFFTIVGWFAAVAPIMVPAVIFLYKKRKRVVLAMIRSRWRFIKVWGLRRASKSHSEKDFTDDQIQELLSNAQMPSIVKIENYLELK